MRTSIVVGLGFGDEGKGLMVDQLSRQSSNALVIRFSGGHQCGHTVVKDDGTRHVFSQFGSGTLSGAKTFYSKNCTVEPVGLVKEYNVLKGLGLTPVIYIDPLAPVATPFDMAYNQLLEEKMRNGSCGVGFGATIERHEYGVKLFVKDLKYPTILLQKLCAIEEYYYLKKEPHLRKKFESRKVFDMITSFGRSAALMFDFAEMMDEDDAFKIRYSGIEDYIFEGNQGILLDAEHGFFPNVTRSSTTTKLALDMIKRHHLDLPEIYYMSRAYSTRHGNGWLPGEGEIEINPNPKETNVSHDWQGEFRAAPLNLELFKYALETDKACSTVTEHCEKNIVFTCVDQLKSTKAFNRFVEVIKDTYPDMFEYMFSLSESSDKELTR